MHSALKLSLTGFWLWESGDGEGHFCANWAGSYGLQMVGHCRNYDLIGVVIVKILCYFLFYQKHLFNFFIYDKTIPLLKFGRRV